MSAVHSRSKCKIGLWKESSAYHLLTQLLSKRFKIKFLNLFDFDGFTSRITWRHTRQQGVPLPFFLQPCSFGRSVVLVKSRFGEKKACEMLSHELHNVKSGFSVTGLLAPEVTCSKWLQGSRRSDQSNLCVHVFLNVHSPTKWRKHRQKPQFDSG